MGRVSVCADLCQVYPRKEKLSGRHIEWSQASNIDRVVSESSGIWGNWSSLWDHLEPHAFPHITINREDSKQSVNVKKTFTDTGGTFVVTQEMVPGLVLSLLVEESHLCSIDMEPTVSTSDPAISPGPEHFSLHARKLSSTLSERLAFQKRLQQLSQLMLEAPQPASTIQGHLLPLVLQQDTQDLLFLLPARIVDLLGVFVCLRLLLRSGPPLCLSRPASVDSSSAPSDSDSTHHSCFRSHPVYLGWDIGRSVTSGSFLSPSSFRQVSCCCSASCSTRCKHSPASASRSSPSWVHSRSSLFEHGHFGQSPQCDCSRSRMHSSLHCSSWNRSSSHPSRCVCMCDRTHCLFRLPGWGCGLQVLHGHSTSDSPHRAEVEDRQEEHLSTDLDQGGVWSSAYPFQG